VNRSYVAVVGALARAPCRALAAKKMLYRAPKPTITD